MAKKHITIDDLAVMVKRGFDDADKRFDEMSRNFDSVKKDIASLKADVIDIRERLENLEKITLKHYNFEIQELKRRVRHLEDLFAIK